MRIEVVAPRPHSINVVPLLERIRQVKPTTLAPFSEETVSFLSEFSKRIFSHPDSTHFAELKALAFWMRKAEIVRYQRAYSELAIEKTLLLPRGVAFHIPPSNVETIAIYSLALSLMVGNFNILRMPSRGGPQYEVLVSIVNDLLDSEQFEHLRDRILFIRYSHNNAVTEALSQYCDIRVIWGGDETVSDVRRARLNPRAREIAFADRFSFAALDSTAFLSLSEVDQKSLVKQFYNDTYVFDQMACSSPRCVFWCGSEEDSRNASRSLFARLSAFIHSSRYVSQAGSFLNKESLCFQHIINKDVLKYKRYSNELTVLRLSPEQNVPHEHRGSGLFFEVMVNDVFDIVKYIEPKDQTLVYFGFDRDTLHAVSNQFGGAGIERVVPIGKGLDFGRFWDGMDLFSEFSKRVWVDC